MSHKIILSGAVFASELLVPRIVGLLTMARDASLENAIPLLRDAKRDAGTLASLLDLAVRDLEDRQNISVTKKV